VIARFAQASTADPRRALVWVRRGGSAPCESAAEACAFRRGLYDASQYMPSMSLEEHWQSFEGPLSAALDELCLAEDLLDARTWLHVLVPYVASQLVRGPEFADRMANRFKSDELQRRARESVAGSRLLEIQRILPLVTIARWHVLRAHEGLPFVLNDRGWAIWQRPGDATASLVFPLTPDSALQVFPTTGRIVLFPFPGRWFAGTKSVQLTSIETASVRQATAQFAWREIYGSIESAVLDVGELATVPATEEPNRLFYPHGAVRVPGEFDWHRLAQFLVKPQPIERLFDPTLDFELLASLPHVPVLNLPTNTPSMETSAIVPVRSEAFGLVPSMSTFLDAWYAAGCPEDSHRWFYEARYWFFRAMVDQPHGRLVFGAERLPPPLTA
jgi:hypothetical protein